MVQPRMRGDQTLVIAYASIEDAKEVEGARVLLEARLYWGADLLGVAHVRPRGVVRVADLGLDAPGARDLVVAQRRQGVVSLVLPNGTPVPAGSRMSLRLGRATLRLELVADDVAVPPPPRVDGRVACAILGAAALHLAIIGSIHRGRGSDASIEAAQRASLEAYLAAAEARAETELARTTRAAAEASHDDANEAEAERGAAGNPTSAEIARLGRRTRGIEARSITPGAEEVRSFGLLALLAADEREGSRAGTSAFAADLGHGAMGNIFGTALGDAEGSAAAELSGTGEGGGGSGAGVPVGGAGKGGGFGVDLLGGTGGRLTGTHQVRSPRCRCGETQVNGRLMPEAVQRVVRANFGRFRACYEEGLKRDPVLEGRVVVKFVIARDGSVPTASAEEGDLPDASVSRCVARRFEQLSFPQPEGGIVTVVYPLTLTPL